MSFLSRTPLEEFFGKLSSEQVAPLLQDSLSKIEGPFMQNLVSNFSYHLTDEAKQWLTKEGVSLCPNVHQVHSHPCSKTVENHILYNILPGIIESYTDLTLLSIKTNKFDRIKRMNKRAHLNVLNRVVTSRDSYRYGPRTPISRMGLHKNLHLFIHDEIHYWGMAQLEDFLNFYEPQTLLATLVYPVELMFDVNFSLLPFCYTFEKEEDHFAYFPDGHRPSAYRQRLDSGDLLRVNKIKTLNHDYAVDMLHSIGSHHIFQIRRICDSEILEAKRYFGTYPYLDIGPLFGKTRVPVQGINSNTLKKVIIYLFSLKKPDPQSAVAKLRQLMNDQIDLQSMWVVRDLCARIQQFNTSWSNVNILTLAKDWVGDLAKKTGLGSLELVRDFQRELMGLSDVKFEIRLNAENTGARLDMESIEEVWMGATSEIKYQDRDRVYLERERAPYYGLAPWVDIKEEICIPQAIALMDRIRAKLEPRESEKLGFGGYLEYPTEERLKGKGPQEDILTDEETGSNSSTSEPEGSIQSSERRGPDSLILTGECTTSYTPDFSNADKVGRREALFYSKEGYNYCYNGGTHKSRGWPEQFNHGIFKPYNSCLVQRYKNNDSIPFHRDNENCYDLDHCPVLTVNLFGKAIFETEGPRKEIQKFLLDENSFLLMPPEFQRDHRHRVTSLTDGRVSLTFRIQVRDCIPRGISYDALLNMAAPYDCFFEALSKGFSESKADIMGLDIQTLRDVVENKGLSLARALTFAKNNGYPISIEHNGLEHKSHEQIQANLRLLDGHYSLKGRKTTLDSRAQERLDKVMHGSEKVRISLIEAIHPISTSVSFKVDKRAAESLFKSLMEGTTGIRSHQVRYDGMKMLHGAKDMGQALTKINGLKETIYEVYTILGFAGSGKSYKLQEWLVENQVKGENLLISPRKNLLNDWREKVRDLEGCTFETALKKDMRPLSLIILDELSLFPHGYLDLLICKLRLSGIEPVIVALGDPLQAKYHSDLDKNKLAKVHEIERLGEVRYLDYTHRLPIKIAHKLSVDTTSTEPGVIGKVYADLPSARVDLDFQPEVILTASRAEKDLYEFNTMTFGESQGLTFDYGLIALAEETKLTSDNALLVALTRFRKGYAYIYNGRTDFDRYKRTSRGLLKRVLEEGPVSKMYMTALTQNKLNPIKLNAKGAGLSYGYREGKPDEMDREEKIQGDPWLKGQIYLGQRVNIASPEEAYIETAKEEMGIHLPISTEKFITIHMDKLKEKYRREILSVRGASDQIRESARTNDRTELNQAWKVESIYLNHTSRDDTTFWAAVKKRLRFSNPETNARKYMAATTSGKVMLKEFLKHVPIRPVLDRALLEEATLEFEEKKLSKPANILEKHSYRSDPDERADMVSIFLKTQLCTKFEKRFVDAKAGQTIACFHHNVLVRFAPLCRYIEKIFTAYLPEHYYIHQKKNFDELEKFVQDHYQGGICVESDYEAFDASQDANVLSFEVELMKHMQLPPQYIEDYKLMKFCLGSKLGNLAIMRFTGEFCTFLFNTFSNMAFTFLRYDIPQKAPILFAGDDMCSLVPLRPTMANWATLERLSLKAKVNFVEKPLFCGWRLTRYGLYKEPALVYERMLISSEKGTIHDTINSYFLEFMYAYKKGGLLEGLMDDEQMDFHHRCVRYILRYQHHLHKENLNLVREWVEEP